LFVRDLTITLQERVTKFQTQVGRHSLVLVESKSKVSQDIGTKVLKIFSIANEGIFLTVCVYIFDVMPS